MNDIKNNDAGRGLSDVQYYDEVPNLEEVPELDNESLEDAMKKVHNEDAYLRHQAQNELNNFLGGLAQEAVQETILNILIESGLTTKEKIADTIKDYTIKRIGELQKDINKSVEEVHMLNPEEYPDLDMRIRSIDIMKEMIDTFMKEAVEQTPENVVPFTKE